MRWSGLNEYWRNDDPWELCGLGGDCKRGCVNAGEWCKVALKLRRLAAYEDTGLTPEEVAALAQAQQDVRLVVLPLPAKEGDPKPDCFYNDNYGLWCLGQSNAGDDEPTDRCKACWYCESGDYADDRE